MISIYNVKKSIIKGEGKFLVELRGLSTEEKPTTLNDGKILNGSAFIEIDTGDVFLFDEENTEWNNITSNNSNNQSDNEEPNNEEVI